MAFTTISNWVTTEWTDEMEALARDKYVPMVKAVGANAVQMVRTGENSFSVVTHYSDEAAAQAAQDKITAIRAEAADELPMTLQSASGGAVFAGF